MLRLRETSADRMNLFNNLAQDHLRLSSLTESHVCCSKVTECGAERQL